MASGFFTKKIRFKFYVIALCFIIMGTQAASAVVSAKKVGSLSCKVCTAFPVGIQSHNFHSIYPFT